MCKFLDDSALLFLYIPEVQCVNKVVTDGLVTAEISPDGRIKVLDLFGLQIMICYLCIL